VNFHSPRYLYLPHDWKIPLHLKMKCFHHRPRLQLEIDCHQGSLDPMKHHRRHGDHLLILSICSKHLRFLFLRLMIHYLPSPLLQLKINRHQESPGRMKSHHTLHHPLHYFLHFLHRIRLHFRHRCPGLHSNHFRRLLRSKIPCLIHLLPAGLAPRHLAFFELGDYESASRPVFCLPRF